MKKVRIENIHKNPRNKGTKLENYFYAQLKDTETNKLLICAGLDYILEAIIEREYVLENGPQTRDVELGYVNVNNGIIGG